MDVSWINVALAGGIILSAYYLGVRVGLSRARHGVRGALRAFVGCALAGGVPKCPVGKLSLRKADYPNLVGGPVYLDADALGRLVDQLSDEI